MDQPTVFCYIYGLIQLVIAGMSLLFTAFSIEVKIGDYDFCCMLFCCFLMVASAGLSRFFIPKQEPKHLLIGLTGESLCLTVSSVAIVFWKEFMWTSSIVSVIAFCFYPFFLKAYVTGEDTYLTEDLTGVNVSLLRTACCYFATLPIFLYFLMQQTPGYPVYGFILHFGVFNFLMQASVVQKATIFREFEENDSGEYRPKVLVRIVEVKEEEKNTSIYNFFKFLRVLT